MRIADRRRQRRRAEKFLARLDLPFYFNQNGLPISLAMSDRQVPISCNSRSLMTAS
jgi:hypothetical protein